MKRLFFVLIIGFALAVWIAMGMHYDLGYVRISFGHWLIETNLWVAMLINLAVLLLVWFITRLVYRIVATPLAVGSWMKNRTSQSANTQSQRGMLAYLEGNWSEAYTLLNRSAMKSSSPLVCYLAAAHSAKELGQNEKAEKQLKTAIEFSPKSSFAIDLARAQIELEQHEYESALASLRRLHQEKPKHTYVLKLLRGAYYKLEDWDGLVTTLEKLQNLKGKGNEESARDAYFNNLAWQKLFVGKTDELLNRNQIPKGAEELASIWMRVPDKLRFSEPLIASYVGELSRLGQFDEAESLLRKALNKQWCDEWVERYGLLQASKPAEQLICAENWLKERPNNAALLLALGRIASRKQLWGKAQQYFEASHRLQRRLETIAEVCRLEQRIDGSPTALDAHYQELISLMDLPPLELAQGK